MIELDELDFGAVDAFAAALNRQLEISMWMDDFCVPMGRTRQERRETIWSGMVTVLPNPTYL